MTHIEVRSVFSRKGSKVLFRYRHDVTFCYSVRPSPLVRSSHKRHNAHAYIHQYQKNTTFAHRMNQGPHLHPSSLAAPLTSASRKRMRENETPSQRTKREKAAERQRRKRERDRQAGLNSSAVQTGDQQTPINTVSAPDLHQHDMSPEEISRRDRVRAAARERQRKHRALVKQRKMRELGLDPMGNELIPGMEQVQYRVHPDGQYTVLPPELQHPPPPPPHGMPEPPFPQGQIPGGQAFASTLLLSFSCAPLLKQHLLRTLSMTNEELASLEPIIAQAWDHWDQQVRITTPPLSRRNAPWLIWFSFIPIHVHLPTYSVEYTSRNNTRGSSQMERIHLVLSPRHPSILCTGPNQVKISVRGFIVRSWHQPLSELSHLTHILVSRVPRRTVPDRGLQVNLSILTSWLFSNPRMAINLVRRALIPLLAEPEPRQLVGWSRDERAIVPIIPPCSSRSHY